MYWTKTQLDEAMASGDMRIRNYFDTFGFVVIREMLSGDQYDRLGDEYTAQYEARDREVMPSNKSERGGMMFLPNFVDSSRVFTDFFFDDPMMDVYKYFAGEGFLYLGSDGSQFVTTSFPWHRDWFTRLPIMKFNFYFNQHAFTEGKFMVIPGSQFPTDAYANLIQKAMAWPMPNKRPGGLGENDQLPDTVNPRGSKLERENSGLPQVPHVELTLKPGDVVIFDHRMVHCVQVTEPEVPRRLLTMLLAKNAYEFSDDHYALKDTSRTGLMCEVLDLVVSERNHINCPAYGDAILSHPFSKSAHFITIDKVDSIPHNNLRYNRGSFNLNGTSKFNKLSPQYYAEIGQMYKRSIGEGSSSHASSQTYSYGDVHLGINAQNIRKVSNV